MRNCLVIFFIIGYCGQVKADIYKKSVDANGIVIYTNKAPVPAAKPIIKTPVLATTPTTGYFYKYQDAARVLSIQTNLARMLLSLVKQK